MSFELRRLFASSSFRLSAIYAALLTVSFVIAGVGAWIASEGATERGIRERVALEMRALQEEMRVEGTSAALAAIHARAESPGALEYRLADRTGVVLFGNLPTEGARPGWSSLMLHDPREAGRLDKFIILTEIGPEGIMLSVGDDIDRDERVRFAVLNALTWVGAAALLLGITAGVFITFGGLRRMDALSNTMRRVSAGDLSARADPRRGGDDIDVIAGGVNEMLAQIDLLIANVRRVSSEIAHDMRTPLTHVRQELEAAAAAQDIDAAQEAVRRAQGKIDDVLRTFSAMLRLAEIESGSVRARFSNVDLSAVIERVTDAYRPDIESSGRALSVGPIEPANVRGDGDLIAQALGNLLENAMRHTPAGTAITVRLVNADGRPRLDVIDGGAGVPEGDRERILKPFARLENSRTSAGAGLGLSIVNAVAQLHRATLTLNDAAPGLRVSLEWPASDRD